MSNTKTKIKFEKRLETPLIVNIVVPIVGVILALIFCSFLLLAIKQNPLAIYGMMFSGAFGSAYGLSETLVKAIPLILASLGVSIAFRMLLWNIGAEGQIFMGAFAASLVPMFLPNLPFFITLPLMFILAAIFGGLWCLLAAIPKALWNVNETIVTLMLNYIAINWVEYLVYGPWKDPNGYNFPYTKIFGQNSWFSTFGTTRVHTGIIIAVIMAFILYFAIQKTRWGYEVKVIGESPKASRYAGMNIKKNILIVMFLSGALAGIAGMGEVAGISHRLTDTISTNFGYTAIIIAWLSRLHPLMIVIVSFLFGGLLVGGFSVQMVGLSGSTALMIQGAILFFILAGDFFTKYKIKVIKG
ncbi:MAG: ABC transporter permease [Oscillospiraceae bacterium]|nr:ABC transporter permease [Oscillospiraceae bacterium]